MRVPTFDDVREAWMRLPPGKRDEIGLLAVDLAFQGYLYGDLVPEKDQVLPDQDARDSAGDRENDRLNQIHRTVTAALPEPFGPEGEHPTWVTGKQKVRA
ncbi:hypothetical protein [Methylobacterium sp. E-045]|uniref:hypothetical protein n=1 Tax=Methylobacterium sp. E-045 TaxID=2836575 RepID=UPI001FB870DD|nr:hypothetical protein [Methylobacterium sp. E-045]MCJ2128000.1 hypothetical protein [Methylobacterium sp. E-045]